MQVNSETEAALGVIKVQKALEAIVAPVRRVTIGKLTSNNDSFRHFWGKASALTLEEIKDGLKVAGPEDWVEKFMKTYFPHLDELYSIRGSVNMIDSTSRLLYMGHHLMQSVEFKGEKINLQQPVIDLALAVNQAVAERGSAAIAIKVVGLHDHPAEAIEKAKQEPLWVVVFAGAVSRV